MPRTGCVQRTARLGLMGIRTPNQMVLIARGAAAVMACALLASCASSGKFASRVDPKYGVSSSPRGGGDGGAVAKGGGNYRGGKTHGRGGGGVFAGGGTPHSGG